MSYNSPEHVKSLLDRIEGSKFDKAVFDETGLFIVKQALPAELVASWKRVWDEFYAASLVNGRNVNVNNPVDLKESLPAELNGIYRNDMLLDITEQVFGPNVGLYNHRFVIKDKFSRGEVFIHQDFCYHLGNPVKASFFVPLSYAGKKNGGLTYYLGTHKYGYLGDAGEINPDAFPEEWPQYTPETQPGDVAIMNSLLWHRSGVNEAGIDRIVADIIYQPANDPSGKELLRGAWQTDIFIDRNINPKDFFRNSRVTKIIALSERLKN